MESCTCSLNHLIDACLQCEEFVMTLQHKSKLRVYRQLKHEIGFEEYLEYVKGAPSRRFFKFHPGTHGLFEELGRHETGVS